MKAIKKDFDHYGLPVFETNDGKSFAVGNQKQIYTAARKAIEESLWCFEADFIVAFLARNNRYIEKEMPESSFESFAESLAEMQSSLCENCNPVIQALIGDSIDSFVEEAIVVRSLANFLAIDNEEHQSSDIEGLPKKRFAFRIE